MNRIIAASILSADLLDLGAEIASIEQAADWLHLDIMDGHFVPGISFGPNLVSQIRSSMAKDCHLMVAQPAEHIEPLARAGASSISFHVESTDAVVAVIDDIKSYGLRVGLALNPETPVATIQAYLGMLDYVLVMSVNPGLGGQEFMPIALEKIRQVRMLDPGVPIQVDGGINPSTATAVAEAGAGILVAGSHIFKNSNRRQAIEELR